MKEHRELFLGRLLDQQSKRILGDFRFPVDDLATHMFICGVTGSGKTVLGKAIIEEAALQGIPSIVVDLKGDLSSLALVFPSAKPEDFALWIESRRGVDHTAQAVEVAETHRSNLAESNVSLDRVERFKRNVQVVIFTPTSKKGIPLGLSSFPPVPQDVREVYDREPETIIGMIDSCTGSLVQRLFPGTKVDKVENERAFLYALVEHAWLHGIDLERLTGLANLIELVQNPPIDKVGVLPLNKHISKRRREELAVKINNLLVGVEKLWHEGQPLDIEALMKAGQEHSRTQVSVINLTELDSIEDRNFVISQLAYAIYNWMKRKGSSAEPRLLVYIDEIGGGGGRQAVYPSFPYNPVSKPALNLLLRQGRSFGVGCILATQNPGDVDYRGLSNCGTWAIGKLSTKRDRDKIIEGITLAEIGFDQIHELLAAPEVGEFLVKMRSGEVQLIRERWLMTYHKTISMSELPALTDLQLRTRFAESALVDAHSQPDVQLSAASTPEKIYNSLQFGRPIRDSFVTVIDPLSMISALLDKLRTINIQPEELSIQNAELKVARIAVAPWKINKIRRDSQGYIRERISEEGTYVHCEAPSPLDDEQIARILLEANKGTSTQWHEHAKRVAAVLPDQFRLTKRKVRQDVAPRYGIPQADVQVELQPVLSIGYEYQLQIEYRGASFLGRVNAVTGDVYLEMPVFSVADALQEAQSQFPDIIGFEDMPEQDGMLYRLTAYSEDFNYDLAIHRQSCKVISTKSTITEYAARKIAYRVELEEPFYVGLHNEEWTFVYDSGLVLRIDRHTQDVVKDQHVDKDTAMRVATAKAKELEPRARLVDLSFLPDRWRLLFRATNCDIAILVHKDASMSVFAGPYMEWVQAKLKELFPSAQFTKSGFRESVDAKTLVTYRSYVTNVDDPRLTCTVECHATGDIEVKSKQVKRDYVEAEAVSLLASFGVTDPHVKDARYLDNQWHLEFSSPEGTFLIIGNESHCRAVDLDMSKQVAVDQATAWLTEYEIHEPKLQRAVHREGIWYLGFSDRKGHFLVGVDTDGCRFIRQRLTEEGALAMAAHHARGEAIAIRKPVLSLSTAMRKYDPSLND
jgi:hypothetical protein